MNILFLSLANYNSFEESNIYTDLLSEFVIHGHNVVAISPVEKRYDSPSIGFDIKYDRYRILKPRIGNITDTAFFEKGVSLLKVGRIFIDCIDNYINENIDLFIVATPPVTNDIISNYVKNKYHAKVYLLLKDIWPGNIFKVKMPGGLITKCFVHLFFRKHEKKLYSVADKIGCMSPANVSYILKNNRALSKTKVHVNPNSIRLSNNELLTNEQKNTIKNKYNIPDDKVCFVYGGTLGPGQDVYNIVKCLKACRDLQCYFIVVGRGLQAHLIKEYLEQDKPSNVSFFEWIPKNEYDSLIRVCDVGLVFLRYDSNTPSFPSRLLSYMNAQLPILSCVSDVTDLNSIVENGNFGWGSYSNDPDSFRQAVLKCLDSDIYKYGERSREFLENNYSASKSYQIIMEQIETC